VTLRVYNVIGQPVRTLAVGHKVAGRYTGWGSAVYWDGRDATGKEVASGVYYYTLQANSFVAIRKMVVLK
jgi:hypothetical protein